MEVEYGQKNFGWRSEGLLFSFKTRMSLVLKSDETKMPLELKPEVPLKPLRSNTQTPEVKSEAELVQVSEVLFISNCGLLRNAK